MSLKALEAEHIQRTLLRYENNISKTAAALGVRRTSLQRKLRAQSSSRKRDASRRGSTNDFQVR
jgi:ActR/RegA family two-component response regulator